MNPLLGSLLTSTARRAARSALPGAPVVPDVVKEQRMRASLATLLRRAADRVEPAHRPAARPVTTSR